MAQVFVLAADAPTPTLDSACASTAANPAADAPGILRHHITPRHLTDGRVCSAGTGLAHTLPEAHRPPTVQTC